MMFLDTKVCKWLRVLLKRIKLVKIDILFHLKHFIIVDVTYKETCSILTVPWLEGEQLFSFTRTGPIII